MSATPDRPRIAVVGAGSMGSHHARLLAGLAGARLAGVYDLVPARAQRLAAEHGCAAFRELSALAEAADGVVVAVPTVAHAEVGCELLAAGCHLLVEKPIAASLADADALLAAAGERLLAVGHVEYFNPAVQALLAHVEGRPGFVEVHRLARFTRRSLDIDVVLDLMIHDLQILHALDPSELDEVRASGVNVLSERADIANARLELASGCVANVTASRVSAERIRKLRVFAPPNYYSVDYQEQELGGVGLRQTGAERDFQPIALEVVRRDPLGAELAAFAAAIRGEPASIVDGRQGRRALATALTVAEALAERAAR